MKKKPAECRECAYVNIGIGYVPDIQYIEHPRVAFLLEAPGGGEVLSSDGVDGYGVPLSGKAGKYFDYQILGRQGFKRKDCLLCNTIRCRPPGNQYPTGRTRQGAESHCRRYDDKITAFNPTVIGITFHPASIFRTPQFEDFVKSAVRKAFALADDGERPLLCCGEKAMNLMAPWLKGGVKRWSGYFFRREQCCG